MRVHIRKNFEARLLTSLIAPFTQTVPRELERSLQVGMSVTSNIVTLRPSKDKQPRQLPCRSDGHPPHQPCTPLSFVASSAGSSLQKSLPPSSSYVSVITELRSIFIQLQSGGSGEGLAPLVNFYSKLPKGSATPRTGGIKARFFLGNNVSGGPYLALILGLFGIGYTLDYQSEWFFGVHLFFLLTRFASALEYVSNILLLVSLEFTGGS